jgi:hypothetical protein
MALAPESSPRPAGLLFYPRHFLLLAGLGIWLAVLTRRHLLSNLDASFAAYGAFHATALVLSLRARGSIAGRCLFVVVGAGLSVLTLHAGMLALQRLGGLSGHTGLYAALGLSAAAGAVTYGGSLRWFGLYQLTLTALAVMAAGCVIATYGAFFVLANDPSLGRWLLAVAWWSAFSGGLWYWDHHRSRQGSSGEHTCSGRTPSPNN